MGNEGGFLSCLILFFILLALNVVLQLANDSYGADFGAHPDEAAHVVTSLMVRDYMVGGFIEELNPVDYAKRYYDFFPKVAIGHYPPLFYMFGGAWLVLSASADWCLVSFGSNRDPCGASQSSPRADYARCHGLCGHSAGCGHRHHFGHRSRVGGG